SSLAVCQVPNALKDAPPCIPVLESACDESLNAVAKLVHAGVSVRPGIHQQFLIEWQDIVANLMKLEEARLGRDQKPDGQLNRRDMLNQAELHNHAQKLAVSFERNPGRERDKGRRKYEDGLAEDFNGANEISTGVSLVQLLQDTIVE